MFLQRVFSPFLCPPHMILIFFAFANLMRRSIYLLSESNRLRNLFRSRKIIPCTISSKIKCFYLLAHIVSKWVKNYKCAILDIKKDSAKSISASYTVLLSFATPIKLYFNVVFKITSLCGVSFNRATLFNAVQYASRSLEVLRFPEEILQSKHRPVPH